MFLQCLSANSQKTPARRLHVSVSADLQNGLRSLECLFFWLFKRHILEIGLSVYRKENSDTRMFLLLSLLPPWESSESLVWPSLKRS